MAAKEPRPAPKFVIPAGPGAAKEAERYGKNFGPGAKAVIKPAPPPPPPSAKKS